MREFFTAQMDYVFFCYGLAFILIAVMAYLILRMRSAQHFWKWIALFGLVHGISEWLDMLALSWGNGAPFEIARIAFVTASFLCFVEMVRLDARKRWGKLFGPWLYVPLLSVTLGVGWILGGLTGVHILSRYIFGVIGGLLAVRVIVTSPASQGKDGKDRTLSAFAWLLGCYVTTQFFAPKGTFLPASMINQDVFFSFLGFPVQLLRMVLAVALARLVWIEYSQEMLKRFPKEETTNRFRKDLWFPAGLTIILLAGWIMVGVAGHDREVEEQDDRLKIVEIAAAMIDPGMIKGLSGGSADLQNEYYKHIHGEFLNIIKNEEDVLCAYLIGQRNGKNIFLFDLDQKSASGGDVYKGDVDLLNRMFLSGGAVTVGPKMNKWGMFVSSLVAISDPADGKIISVLGFDYGTKEWKQRIARYRLGAILITFLFAMLFVVFFTVLKREVEIRRNVQKMGELIKETQGRFQNLVETSFDWIWECDENGIYTYVSPRVKDLLGYEVSEVLGKTPFDFMSAEEGVKIKEIFREKLANKEAFHGLENINRHKDGHLVVLETSGAPILDEKGQVIGYRGTDRDITERKKADQALRESEKRFMDILYAAQDAILLIDGEKFVDCNEATAQMLGYPTRKNFLMTHPSELSPPQQPDGKNSFGKANEMMSAAFAQGFHRFEWIHRKADGTDFPVEVSLTPISIHGRSILHCLWRDLTKQKRMEEEKERLLAIIEESKDFIGVADPQGNLLYHNPAAKKMVGLPVDADLSHLKIKDMHPGWAAKIVEEEGIPAILSVGSWRGETALLHRNGSEISVSQLLLLHRDPSSGKPVFISTIMRDITEEKRLIEALKGSRENLEAQVKERTAELVSSFQKLQVVDEELKRASKAKSEFLANMSHELRTPLNSIIGFSEVLHDERFGPLNERQKRYAQNVMVSGRHLLSLINDVLDLSKVEAGKMTLEAFSFPVRDCVEEVLRMMENQALAKKIKPVVEIPEDLGGIFADLRKIKQVIFNLLSNAIKFTPAGGKVGIRGRRIEDGVEMTVWDTGIGISPENLEKAFGAFERLGNLYTQETEGTGLGLTISRKIIGLHGGKMWIESEGIGKGTAVKFTIPSGAVK